MYVRLRIRIDSGGSALVDNLEGELRSILGDLAKETHLMIREGDGVIHDSNGNRVGGWSLGTED